MTTPTTPASVRPSRVEVHVPVDAADVPYGWTEGNQLIIETGLANDGLLELALPLDDAPHVGRRAVRRRHSDGPLRAGLVESLTARFNTTRIAVSGGVAIDP